MTRRTFLQSVVTLRQSLWLGVSCAVTGGICFGFVIEAAISGDAFVAGVFAVSVGVMAVVATLSLRIVSARLRDE